MCRDDVDVIHVIGGECVVYVYVAGCRVAVGVGIAATHCWSRCDVVMYVHGILGITVYVGCQWCW